MDAVEALALLRALGLKITPENGRLIVQPAELLDDDTRWLIRTHKDAILTELLDDSPRFAWRVRFGDGRALDIYRHPDATRAEVLLQYPDALDLEPVPEAPSPATE